MLHLSWSGASGFADPWFVDLANWLLGMLIRSVFNFEWCEIVSTLSFSLASSKWTVTDSLAKFLINSSRRWSSDPLPDDDEAPQTSSASVPADIFITLLCDLWFAIGVFMRERACNWGLLFNPIISPLEVLALVLLSSWLLSNMIKSCSTSTLRLLSFDNRGDELAVASVTGAGKVVDGVLVVGSSVLRSRCCLSRTTCDWRRAYRWLGRLSNWTLRRARLVWVVWYSVRPLEDISINLQGNFVFL